MPQASLLSYFSKPETPVASVQASPPRHEDVKKDHDASVSLPEHPRWDDHVPKGKKRIQTTTAAPSTEESEDFGSQTKVASRFKPNSSQCIQIAHLPEAFIAPVSEGYLPAIRRLTATTLPVRYSDAFFTTTVTDPIVQHLSRVALYESEPVGWIRCRLELCSPASSFVATPNPPVSRIYIQALALLSPFRNLGLATILLNTILSSTLSLVEDPAYIYAHVWEKNEDALDWYAKRGFKRVMLVEHYYRKLIPSGALIVRRELHDT